MPENISENPPASALPITSATLDDIAAIHAAIPDFHDGRAANPPDPDFFAARCAGPDALLLAAILPDGRKGGYIAAYDRYHDGSLYCWMAGTIPAARGCGVMGALLDRLAHDAAARGHDALRIKTHNRWFAMRALLARRGWLVTAIEPRPDPLDTRLILRFSLQQEVRP